MELIPTYKNCYSQLIYRMESMETKVLYTEQFKAGIYVGKLLIQPLHKSAKWNKSLLL